MEIQSNETQNLDSQEQLAQQYALKENARYSGSNGYPPKKNGMGFGAGILIGSICTMLVVFVVFVGPVNHGK